MRPPTPGIPASASSFQFCMALTMEDMKPPKHDLIEQLTSGIATMSGSGPVTASRRALTPRHR